MQTGAVAISKQNFSRTPFLPPLMGEDWYELDHCMTGFQVRQEGYWEVLSGCYLGGCLGMGRFGLSSSTNGGHEFPSWQSQLSHRVRWGNSTSGS